MDQSFEKSVRTGSFYNGTLETWISTWFQNPDSVSTLTGILSHRLLHCRVANSIFVHQVSFTSITNWELLHSGKLHESLKSGMQQLCNNVMGHLVSLNYYPVIKVINKKQKLKEFSLFSFLFYICLGSFVERSVWSKEILEARSRLCVNYFVIETTSCSWFF